MAKKKRRTVPRLVPEDPDRDIEDRDEALQPDLTEAQRNKKVSGEALAARDRDNTYHGRKSTSGGHQRAGGARQPAVWLTRARL
ncbi:hypothetical protein HaLaN_31784, partial [Haematococcus lacustris]